MTSRTEGDVQAGPPRRASVIGTGLIGASIGIALRSRGWHVTGRDLDPLRQRQALDLGALDSVGEDPDAEVLFIATPASSVAVEACKALDGSDRRSDLIVTDVAGVKTSVVAQVNRPAFVGGHPMAGSEQIGLQGVDPDLFVGATWVLTPTESTDPEMYARLRDIVSSLGADAVALSPEQHDSLVAVVSHVPHLAAATLMNLADSLATEHAALLRLAAGGFRDMTRVAAGDPAIWPDICIDNSEAIVHTLDLLLANLKSMRDKIASANRSALLDELGNAAAARRSLPSGTVQPEFLAEIRVPVPDRPGVLSEITTLAGDMGVNILDLEIAHSAEGDRGVLVLVVDRSSSEILHGALTERSYRSTVRHLGQP